MIDSTVLELNQDNTSGPNVIETMPSVTSIDKENFSSITELNTNSTSGSSTTNTPTVDNGTHTTSYTISTTSTTSTRGTTSITNATSTTSTTSITNTTSATGTTSITNTTFATGTTSITNTTSTVGITSSASETTTFLGHNGYFFIPYQYLLNPKLFLADEGLWIVKNISFRQRYSLPIRKVTASNSYGSCRNYQNRPSINQIYPLKSSSKRSVRYHI
ncbi:unnamed protein product [Rotaria sp. Silwood2]|nr:unnamed protein product [Rotaria sp. Silwood2]